MITFTRKKAALQLTLDPKSAGFATDKQVNLKTPHLVLKARSHTQLKATLP